MLFKEFGDKNNKTIILLHGGGLSWWSYKAAAEALQEIYHIVIPVIDGHGEDGDTTFVSIEDSACKVIKYIESCFNGHVHTIGGLSLGAQITAEVLSRKPDIADFAFIESGLMIPIRGTKSITIPAFKIFYGFASKRWFAKAQAKSLCIPQELFEKYFEDSKRMTKASLVNMALSNGLYAMRDSIRDTKAKVLILYGSKELGIMKKSAERLHGAIQNSTVSIAQGMKHGELSLLHTEEFLRRLRAFQEPAVPTPLG